MPDTADDAPGHPTAGLFLLLFKGAAMAYYILCGWFPGTNFIVNFCVVAFLLVCDFWTVRKKFSTSIFNIYFSCLLPVTTFPGGF